MTVIIRIMQVMILIILINYDVLSHAARNSSSDFTDKYLLN